jgi:hypothetical protein
MNVADLSDNMEDIDFADGFTGMSSSATFFHATKDSRTDSAKLDSFSEIERLKSAPYSYVRQIIKSQVSDCYWLEELKRKFDSIKEQELLSRLQAPQEGNYCVVCTLPLGTCEHSHNWRKQAGQKHGLKGVEFEDDDFKAAKFQDDVDKEIESLLEGIGGELALDRNAKPSFALAGANISGMLWSKLPVRLSDKIGDTPATVSMPSDRGWHSSVNMSNTVVIIFGGLRYK